ncbi:hypothetical protein KP509_19G054700 [Ceratopteris richardii]|uniref:Peptidase S54 rhomboid domain-containing protein n=1 Tax=Ceratopteris richardii TaxID=49495 RepID=A0A8T2SMK0_CERRI|nr:hypothetical protein KP509_19G054700 [Ceratopteris richardii]
MDLLGFGSDGLSNAHSLFLNLNPIQKSNLSPTQKFRLFAAGSRIRMTQIVISAGSFFNHIQSDRGPLHRQGSKSNNFSVSHIGRGMHAFHAFRLLGGLELSIASLGSSSLLFKIKNIKKTDDGKKSTTTRAFIGVDHNGGNKLQRRFWTNVLIGLNVLVYIAQEVSHGRLLLLGAKINSLIDKGQLWRFITPAFLHASLPHLMTNCYSLHSIGPVIEAQGGAARFLTVYFGSAFAGFFLSYSFTSAPAVGASGAVFGLVGSLAVYLIRHKELLTGASQSLSNVARMIAVNLVLGLATSKIDNWGHLGGLVGGAAISWFVGPSFSYKRVPGEKKMVLVDHPPVAYLLPQAWRDRR